MLGLFKEYNGGLILEHESVQSTMLTEKKKKKEILRNPPWIQKKTFISFKIHS